MGAFDLTAQDALLIARDMAGELTLGEKIDKFIDGMKHFEAVDVPVEHILGGGIYARRITVKKGTALEGAIHLTEHMNIIVSGDIDVATEYGVERIVGHRVIVSKPGSNRIGFANEDTVWITLHATEETDLDKLKTMLIATGRSDPRLLALKEKLWLG